MFQKRRVEQDLQRIREANLPHIIKENTDPSALKKKEPPPDRIGMKDVLAMVIAVFSIVLPYALFFIGGLGVFVYVLSRLLR